jgi:hypothetical protein
LINKWRREHNRPTLLQALKEYTRLSLSISARTEHHRNNNTLNKSQGPKRQLSQLQNMAAVQLKGAPTTTVILVILEGEQDSPSIVRVLPCNIIMSHSPPMGMIKRRIRVYPPTSSSNQHNARRPQWAPNARTKHPSLSAPSPKSGDHHLPRYSQV